MTPKDVKALKRSVALGNIVAFTLTLLVGALLVANQLGVSFRSKPEPPDCLAPVHSWKGMEGAWTIADGRDQVWLCSGDVGSSGVHCTRLIERPAAECSKWAAEWNEKNRRKSEALP